MVAAFDYCLHGRGGAAPSIDTAMHGLVDAAPRRPSPPRLRDRVRDRRRRRGPDRALLRRPGRAGSRGAGPASSSAWTSPRSTTRPPRGDRRDPRRARHHRLGRDVGRRARRNSLEIIRTAERFIAEHGRPEPFGAVGRRATSRCRAASAGPARPRSCPSCAGSPRPTARRSATSPTTRRRARLPRPRAEHPRLAALGTSCPDHFLRTKVRPLVLDLPPTRAARGRRSPGSSELHAAYREDYRAYYERHATPDSPPMRGADPAIVLVPGVGMFSFGANKQTARVAGEFYVNAINVMRGAEALSTYAPIPESEKFRIEYWALEEAKLARLPKPKPLADPGRARDRRRIGHRPGDRPPARRRGRLRRRRRHRRGERARPSPREIGGPDVGRRRHRRRHRRGPGRRRASGRPSSRSAASTSSSTTPACRSRSRCSRRPSQDWDLQHDVMARGSFLVSREAARIMIDQGMGGDIVYIVSKNALFAGPNNVAYGASKADQAHQVRLLAAELGAVRDPGQRREPRRRRPRVRDLRQGLGRRPRPDLRHPGGQARRVLRPADAAQAARSCRSTSPRRCSP